MDGVDNVASLTPDQLAGLRYIGRATVTDVYMMMGRELESLAEVPAGNILGDSLLGVVQGTLYRLLVHL